MSDSKTERKENLFAKLAMQNAKAISDESAAPKDEIPAIDPPPSPALVERGKPKALSAKKPEPVKGKRDNPEYCQANAYVPKRLRRAVDKALLDMDDMDYSTLVTELLRKWLKTRGVAE